MTVSWSTEVFDELRRAQVRQVACAPDAGLSALIKLCAAAADLHSVTLTTEEEGVALLAGAWLGSSETVSS